jgi:long-chain acyl-CoA synthetase
MEHRSLASFFENFGQNGSECAFVNRRGYRAERWSYAEVYERASGLGHELEQRGLSKGDRALLWAENSAEWVVAFIACVLAGVVVVPIDDAASSDFARRVAAQVQAKAVFCSRQHAGDLREQSPFIVGELGKGLKAASSFRSPELNHSDILQIVFTSGTTAEPKGVVITHGNVLANIGPLEEEIRKYLKYERWVHPIRFLNLLPLSHVFGQFLALYLPPIMSGTVIFQNVLSPAEVIETIRRERVSVLVAVPRMLQSLRDKIKAEWDQQAGFEEKLIQAADKHYFRRWWMFRRVHWRFGLKFWACICGGAALDRETEEFWRRLGFAVIQGYGLTETTSLVSVNHPFRVGKGSIGKILPGREVKLADDGEILVRGGGVANARWAEGSLQPIEGEQGWYRTGDMGALDPEGNLYFKGRKKETIVTSAGMNIYPEDLEAALRTQPEVKDCVVVPVTTNGNEEPCAVLISRADRDQLSAAIDRANSKLAEYQRIRVWQVWPEPDFPRTSTQKPKRQLIREISEAKIQSRANGDRSTEAIAQLIGKIAGRTPAELARNVKLDEDLKLSSLERVELLSALEERYQVDLSEARFAQADSAGEIADLLQGQPTQGRRYHYPGWTLAWPVAWIRAVAFYVLVRPAIVLLGWPKILGRNNLKNVRGPVLVVSNHIDDVDVGFIQAALPARLRHQLATATGGEALELLRTPEANAAWWRRLFSRVEWFLGVSLLNLFPLPREAGYRRSFAYAGEAVDKGYSILIFPEGRHTTDGKLNPFRSGIGLLTNNLGIPVVPMRIDGLYEVKKAGRKFARPGQIQVRIGSPIEFSTESTPEEVAAALQRAVAQL